MVIVMHRHRNHGLLLSELGGYLMGAEQAPAGTKRISNLIHSSALDCDSDSMTIFGSKATRRSISA